MKKKRILKKSKENKVDSNIYIAHSVRNKRDLKSIDKLDNKNLQFSKYSEIEQKLGTDYKNAETKEAKVIVLREVYKTVQAERKAALKQCTTNEQKDIINQYYDAILNRAMLDFAAGHQASEAYMGVLLGKGEDFAKNSELTIKIRTKEGQTEAADSYIYENLLAIRKHFYEDNDSIPAEVYGNGLNYIVQKQSLEAARQLEEDAYNFRLQYERGEVDAPWMSEEYFKAEALAIGTGITNNENMTSEQKAELLNTWEKHIDYDVKEAYNAKINKSADSNPRVENDFNQIKTILKEKYNTDIESLPRVWKKRNKKADSADANSDVRKSNASEVTLVNELKKKTLAEAKQDYLVSVHDFVKVILHNDKELRNRVQDTFPYFEGKSGIDIGIMLADAKCTTSTISAIISKFPSKKDDILKMVLNTVCFDGRQKLEKV